MAYYFRVEILAIYLFKRLESKFNRITRGFFEGKIELSTKRLENLSLQTLINRCIVMPSEKMKSFPQIHKFKITYLRKEKERSVANHYRPLLSATLAFKIDFLAVINLKRQQGIKPPAYQVTSQKALLYPHAN